MPSRTPPNSWPWKLLDQLRRRGIALVPRLEADERHADVLAAADEAETADREHGVDFGLVALDDRR